MQEPPEEGTQGRAEETIDPMTHSAAHGPLITSDPRLELPAHPGEDLHQLDSSSTPSLLHPPPLSHPSSTYTSQPHT